MVVSYPALSKKDFGRMQAIGAEHDELYYWVASPHFTLAFPVCGFDRDRFVEHAKE